MTVEELTISTQTKFVLGIIDFFYSSLSCTSQKSFILKGTTTIYYNIESICIGFCRNFICEISFFFFF